MMKLLLLIVLSLFCLAVSKRAPYKLSPLPPATTLWIEQPLDHFNFEVKGTYKQRYLYNDQYWGTKSYKNFKGPIFFYTGNESPVTDYWDNSGFFTQVLAEKYGAMIVMGEHRYFGKSTPFNGTKNWEPQNVGYLSSDQALADYAVLLRTVKTAKGAQDCPVVAFGGSYGGMLTTWFRLKYPNEVIGGLAASAPMPFLGSGVSPFAFTEAATETFRQANIDCPTLIGSAFEEMAIYAKTSAGRAILSSKFKVCKPLKTEAEANELIGWVDSGLSGMCMLDYPYATNYGISLPAWPVNQTCSKVVKEIAKGGTVLDALASGIGTIYNNTGSWKCYDIHTDVPSWGICCGWNYLACTDVYFPEASNGMFPFSAYNQTEDAEACYQEFTTPLRPNWPLTHWGGIKSIKASSNIIFSNGLLDPWHTSGILHDLSPTLIAIVIPEAAHHLDLRAPNPKDPIYVTEARFQEESIIQRWIYDFDEESTVEKNQKPKIGLQ